MVRRRRFQLTIPPASSLLVLNVFNERTNRKTAIFPGRKSSENETHEPLASRRMRRRLSILGLIALSKKGHAKLLLMTSLGIFVNEIHANSR